MKFLIVLIACVAFVAAQELTDEQKAKARASAEACMAQEGVSAEQVKDLRAGKFDNVDNKAKCFAHCFLEKSEVIADGQIKPDIVTKKLAPIFGADVVKEAQAKCDALKGADKCDTAFQIYQCYYKNKAYVPMN
ncbi:Obp56d [Drosophila busckii]|uniref:Obp56d n=1 Tax=Drosophila busckii TaxID=30019 RepID=A0A0M4EX16_DROBS|nr:general odorant-binding protein 56d [Drosophila busckii]ALC42762.1 Obp56d [Drosophila busckii]